MDSFIIEFEINNPKLISINDQYIHPVRKVKTKNGKDRYVSYFAKSPYLKEVQSFYKEVLNDKISDEEISKIKSIISDDKSKGLSLFINIGMPSKEIFEHDVSNFIKSIEDCLVTRTGIDDSRNFLVTSTKSIYSSEDDSWIVKIKISTIEIKNYE